MTHKIADVRLLDSVIEKADANGIDEDMVWRALTASSSRGDPPPLFVRSRKRAHAGEPTFEVLAQDPATGTYLEMGIAIEPNGTARCFHVRPMRARLRGRYEHQR
jgi:hypothetical protein